MADRTEDEIRRLFEAQHASHQAGPATTAAQRVAKLKRLKRTVQRHRTALCEAAAADFRKHPVETEITELQPLFLEINHLSKHLARWMRPHRVGTHWLLAAARSEIRYEPKGVVLVITPWNYPINLTLTPICAAVAAGNRVVVKPSEKAAATAAAVAAVLEEAFPDGEVACVAGGHETAKLLLSLPFDHIFFTGSAPVGRRVMAAAAEHLAGVTLELGGKSPAIIAPDADPAFAAERVAWGKFVNAGQTCIAPDYVLVHQTVAAAFLPHLERAITRFYGSGEAARRDSPYFCRLIDDAAWERVAAGIDAAVREGGRVELGGTLDRDDRYIAPTVLSGVTPDTALMREEIFGPVLPVLTYRTVDEAISIVRERPAPLVVYVFSRRTEFLDKVLAATPSGGALWNNVLVHFGNPHLPFGGTGSSGQGSYHGWFGFRALSHERAVMQQRWFSLSRFLRPPYGRRARLTLRLLKALVG